MIYKKTTTIILILLTPLIIGASFFTIETNFDSSISIDNELIGQWKTINFKNKFETDKEKAFKNFYLLGKVDIIIMILSFQVNLNGKN
ncbi:MAG: hypothetical protein AB1498_12145 [bacterium]